MRILIVHNKYQQRGGEDSVVESEGKLLQDYGNNVDFLIFDNSEIRTLLDKFLAGFKILYNPTSARLLRQKINSFRPDIIHVHNFVPLASPSVFFVAKQKRIPIVFTVHNYRLICPSATLFYNGKIYENSVKSFFPFHAILKGVYRNSRLQTALLVFMTTIHNILGTWSMKVDKYILLTEFARDKFKQSTLRMSSDQLLVKPNFVFDYGEGKKDRADYFLYVGRLSEEKGIETLLTAAKQSNFTIYILGDGPLRGMVELFAATNSNVKYLGFRNKEEIIRYLSECKALLFPSIWYEGFPMIILEAFSTSTPVISSHIGSMIEIVNDMSNGLHFTVGDGQDLAKKMKVLLNDVCLAKSLSEKARETYLNNYTPEINYPKLESIYTKVIAALKSSEKF